jgi:uncharacterized protein (TIGR03000 family)
MPAYIRTTLAFAFALTALAIASMPTMAQSYSERYYPYYNYNTTGNPVPEQTLPDPAALRAWYNRPSDRDVQYLTFPRRPPTNLTSINYPLVYGAYIYPFPMGRYTYGAMPSPFSNAPTIYGDYYVRTTGVMPPDTVALTSFAPQDTAQLRVHVPADAVVRLEGIRMTQRGEDRRYTVPGLVPGTTYAYDVAASWREPTGEEVTRHRTLKFQAGDEVAVDLLAPTAPSESTLRTRPLPR